MLKHKDSYNPPSTRPLIGEGDPLPGLTFSDKYTEQQVEDGVLCTHLRAGAEVVVAKDYTPLVEKDEINGLIGVNADLVASLSIGQDNDFLILRLSPDPSEESELYDDGSMYAIADMRSVVWLNLTTQELASDRTKEDALAGFMAIGRGEVCQIGRGSSEDHAGYRYIETGGHDCTVSRKHVKIICHDDGSLKILDMHSINGVRIETAVE